MENVYIRRSSHCTHEVRAYVYLSFRGEHKAREGEKERKVYSTEIKARDLTVEAVEGTAALSNSPSTARHVGWSRPDFAKYGITNAHVRARVLDVVIRV